MDILETLYKHKKGVLFGAIGLMVLIVSWVIYYNNFVFRVVSTDPTTGTVSYLIQRFTVSFTQPIDPTSVRVSSENVTTSQAVSGKNLILSISNSLSTNANYTIVIDSISSLTHNTITHYVINFATNDSSNGLSAADQKIILDTQQAHKDPALADPILSYLPYSTLDYTLAGVINGDHVTVVITITLTAADIKSGSTSAVNQYQAEAMNYLSHLKGIDISKYTVTVTVVQPTL